MTPAPLIECGHCRGVGRVEMPPFLAETLVAIALSGSTTATLRKCLDLEAYAATSINQRLAKLEALGMVRRQKRRGRGFLWFRVKP